MGKKKKGTTVVNITYLICSGRIIQDEISKKYSYIDLFDLIIIPSGNDYFYQTFYVGGKLSIAQPSKYKMVMRIEDSDNNILGKVDFPETDLVAGDVPLSAFFSLVKFSKAGRHHIRISVNGEDIKDDDKFYFDVVKLGGESEKKSD